MKQSYFFFFFLYRDTEILNESQAFILLNRVPTERVSQENANCMRFDDTAKAHLTQIVIMELLGGSADVVLCGIQPCRGCLVTTADVRQLCWRKSALPKVMSRTADRQLFIYSLQKNVCAQRSAKLDSIVCVGSRSNYLLIIKTVNVCITIPLNLTYCYSSVLFATFSIYSANVFPFLYKI